MSYENRATAVSPAVVIFVLDMSGSMGGTISGGKTRIDAVNDALRATATEMVQRSLRNREVRPRYRMAIIGYSDEAYDILKGVLPVDAVAKMGIPKLHTMNRTNTAKGLRSAKQVLEEEIAKWPLVVDGETTDPDDYPAPLVIHLTDGEYTPSTGDPEPIAREIQQIAVPDGNVLVENVFISTDLRVSTFDAKDWPGYAPNEDLRNPYANKLLSMSSRLPPLYGRTMSEMGMSQLRPGTAMMFPGIDPEFVKLGFATSMGTSILLDPTKFHFESELVVTIGASASGVVVGKNIIQGLIDTGSQNAVSSQECFAVARIEDIATDSVLEMGKSYKLLAGVVSRIPVGFVGALLQLPSRDILEVDIIVRTADMEILPNWVQTAHFFRDRDSGLVEFTLVPKALGQKLVLVEFYHERHWLAQISFKLEVVDELAQVRG